MGTESYTLGRGILYFNRKQADGTYLGELPLGNAPEFSFSVAVDKLDHFSSQGGLKAKDKQVISQITPSCKFTLDEINVENLALLTLASMDAEVVANTGSATTVTSEATANVTAGHYVFLANRNVQGITTLTLSDATTPLVVGTDYRALTDKDKEFGRIYILPGTTVGTLEGIGDTLLATYTVKVPASRKIKTFLNTTIEGMLHYVSDNPVGKQTDIKMWSVSLTPSGDTSLIGTDWATIAFEGEILKDEANHASSPYFDINVIG